MTTQTRPFVFMNMAVTLDGKITSAHGEYPKFTSPHDRANMDVVRAKADAILVGSKTLITDNPRLDIRDAALRAERVKNGLPAGLTYIALTRRAELPTQLRFFTDQSAVSRIVATVDTLSETKTRELSEHAEVWKLGHDDVSIPALLERLYQRGIKRLLVEGGGDVNYAFFKHDAVDELYLTIAPAILGGRNAPTLVDGEGFVMSAQKRLELIEAVPIASELFCRYRVVYS